MEGPEWLKGFKGNEYERTLRRLQFHGARLQDTHPKKHADLNKRLRYLFKDMNKRKRKVIISKRL